ncbi:RING-type domain-containing protein [Mycena chlorophos]|uniref:RING-type domain-containing protein n=1 Tax=Mycena chlorophos TaxID=658473 RepID=A0A8H6RXG4_MYCCL|nr:RING-type domain-containing protein [Mycena chlorophos]
MQNLLLNFFADEGAQRAQASITMDQDDFTPLFIVSLVLPGQECGFQIFEPRYRTMLRRCLEHHHKPQSTSGFPTMGLMMHTAAYSTTAQYGCIVDILEVQMMYDGRAILQVRGTTPFRVLEDTGSRDGHSVARYPAPSRTSPTPRTRPRLYEPAERAHVRDLVQICVAFFSSLRRHGALGQDVLDRIMWVYGAPLVHHPGLLGFWFARLLPGADVEKARMLAIRSPRDRLERVIRWISRVAGPEPE